MSTRYFSGNVIRSTPVEPSDDFGTTSANGVWDLTEAFSYRKVGSWPTAGNVSPIAFIMTGRAADNSTTLRNVDRINITTLGNAVDDSEDLPSGASGTNHNSAACSDGTKAFQAGGSGSDFIHTKNYADGSTAVDFGDLTAARSELGGYSNTTRGIFGGGAGGFYGIGTIDYITMASAGDATDFGDFSAANRNQQCEAGGSTTRAIFVGFESDKKKSDYINPASTGNATNYADTSANHNNAYVASNLTRIIVAAEYLTGDTIEYNTISSTGGWSDFGDCTTGGWGAAVANSTRCLFAGGTGPGGSTSTVDTIEYITIGSTGNTTDFGDLVAAKRSVNGAAPSTPSVVGS
jgi:hypothetical protein